MVFLVPGPNFTSLQISRSVNYTEQDDKVACESGPKVYRENRFYKSHERS